MFGHRARMAFVVWSTPHPGVGSRFHEWYDEVHLPDALDNGSFVAMHRYEFAGPGYCVAPYLSVAEADYGSEREAWDYVAPRAQALHDAGRVEDLYRVEFATMLIEVSSDLVPAPAETLTTVQNDWRAPGGDASGWLESVATPATPPHSVQLFTTDADGRHGPGRHLALFESAAGLDETVAAWESAGTPGSTPLPRYTTIFGKVDDRERGDEPDPAEVWVAHWRHLKSLRR